MSVKVLVGFNAVVGVIFLVFGILMQLAGYSAGVGSHRLVIVYLALFIGSPLLIIIGASCSARWKKAGPVITLAGAWALTIYWMYEAIGTAKPQPNPDFLTYLVVNGIACLIVILLL